MQDLTCRLISLCCLRNWSISFSCYQFILKRLKTLHYKQMHKSAPPPWAFELVTLKEEWTFGKSMKLNQNFCQTKSRKTYILWSLFFALLGSDLRQKTPLPFVRRRTAVVYGPKNTQVHPISQCVWRQLKAYLWVPFSFSYSRYTRLEQLNICIPGTSLNFVFKVDHSW